MAWNYATPNAPFPPVPFEVLWEPYVRSFGMEAGSVVGGNGFSGWSGNGNKATAKPFYTLN